MFAYISHMHGFYDVSIDQLFVSGIHDPFLHKEQIFIIIVHR